MDSHFLVRCALLSLERAHMHGPCEHSIVIYSFHQRQNELMRLNTFECNQCSNSIKISYLLRHSRCEHTNTHTHTVLSYTYREFQLMSFGEFKLILINNKLAVNSMAMLSNQHNYFAQQPFQLQSLASRPIEAPSALLVRIISDSFHVDYWSHLWTKWLLPQ